MKERTAGWMHFFIFWGFMILGIQVTTMFARAFFPDFYLFPFTPGLLGGPYWLVRDIFEALVFVCIMTLLDALARHAAEAALRLRAGRGTASRPLALGGVPDPRLHRRSS